MFVSNVVQEKFVKHVLEKYFSALQKVPATPDPLRQADSQIKKNHSPIPQCVWCDRDITLRQNVRFETRNAVTHRLVTSTT